MTPSRMGSARLNNQAQKKKQTKKTKKNPNKQTNKQSKIKTTHCIRNVVCYSTTVSHKVQRKVEEMQRGHTQRVAIIGKR
jgi:hypothetical protein